MRVLPVGAGVDTAGHIQPFDDDGAVEGRRLLGPEDDDSSGVGRGRRRRDRPHAVRSQRPRVRGVGVGRSREEELRLPVAHLVQVERHHVRGLDLAGATGDRPRDGRGVGRPGRSGRSADTEHHGPRDHQRPTHHVAPQIVVSAGLSRRRN